MTEFWLILAINVAGLTFSLLLARWLTARDAGAAEIRRLGSAIERAAKSFLAREYRLIAVFSGLLALLALALHAGLARFTGSTLQSGAWTALGLLAGAACCSIVTYFGADLSLRGTLRTLAGAHLSLDRALTVSLRAGGVVAILVEAAAALGVFGMLALGFALSGAAGPEPANAVMPLYTTLLPGFAIGAVTAALAIQRGGSTYHAATDIAADFAGEREFSLDHDDARNPAVVSDLVGDHVGVTAARAADHFVLATGANIAALLVGAAMYQANRDVPTLLAFPVALRAFGVLACSFGVMVVRSDDTSAVSGVWRGYLSTVVIALAGLAGVGIWLLSGTTWTKLLLAGAVGLAATTLTAWAARFRVERRHAPLRDALDALRTGEATAVSQGIGVGLGALSIPAALLGAALFAAYQLGTATGLARGGLLGAHAALTLMLSGAVYAAAIGNFAPIADSARGIANMALRGGDVDMQRRAARLDDTAFSCGVPAQTYLLLSAGASGLLTAGLLPVLIQGPVADLGLTLRGPAAPVCGALGAAFVLACIGTAVRRAALGARAVSLEVDRQLRDFQKDHSVPREFTPSYRACIELAVNAALERLPAAVGFALIAPLAVAAGLRLAYSGNDHAAAALGLTWFSLIAAATGLAVALVAEAIRSTLTAARRASPTREGSPSFAASLGVDAVADVLGGAALPTAHLVIKSTALVALAAAPFLI